MLPAGVQGWWLGINSLAGGGDQGFHSQTLAASHPGRAGQPSGPHVLCWLSTILVPWAYLTFLQSLPPLTDLHPSLGESPWDPLGRGRPLGSGPQSRVDLCAQALWAMRTEGL